MSTQTTADAVQQPVDSDINAEAAKDVQRVLAELDAAKEGEAAKATEAGGANGVVEDSVEDVKKDGHESKDAPAAAHGDIEKKDAEARQSHGDKRGGGRGRGRGGRGGGGRGDQRGQYKNNIKSDLTTQEETDDPVQIRKQVEFYFSDSNLPMDKFLLSQVGGSNNFPVDLNIIHSFKRMRRFQPFPAIVAALKESQLLEVTDDDTKVKRRKPLPEHVDPEKMDDDAIKVFEDRAMPRSVYAKGFGPEDKGTQLDIEAFFSQYGSWNAVRLRRAFDKTFKGSVFVEFDTEETLDSFLALDPKPQYKGRDLQIMSKKAYCDKKVEDIKAGKIRPHSRENNHHQNSRGGRGRGRGGHQNKRKRDDEDDRDWRERRDGDRRDGVGESRRGGKARDGHHQNGRSDVRRDARGVPVVEATNTATTTTTASTSTPTSRDTTYAKREAATAEALAQARAVVEAQQKQEHEQSQNGQRQDNGAAGDGGNKEEGQTDQTAENNATTISAGAKRQRGAESVSPGAAGQAPITTGAETGAAAPEDVSRDDDSEVPPSKKARQD